MREKLNKADLAKFAWNIVVPSRDSLLRVGMRAAVDGYLLGSVMLPSARAIVNNDVSSGLFGGLFWAVGFVGIRIVIPPNPLSEQSKIK